MCRAAQSEASLDVDQDGDLVGEDAAFFDVEKQTTKSWTLFTGLLVGVLGLVYVVRPSMPASLAVVLLLTASSRTIIGLAGMDQS